MSMNTKTGDPEQTPPQSTQSKTSSEVGGGSAASGRPEPGSSLAARFSPARL